MQKLGPTAKLGPAAKIGLVIQLGPVAKLGLVATVSGDTNDVVRKQIPRKGEFIEPEGVVELTVGN